MAYGPIPPISAVPNTGSGRAFDYIVDGGSATGVQYEQMMGIEASLSADTIWHLIFPLPETQPTGTCKLRLWMNAGGTSGNGKVNPKWAISGNLENPALETLSAEGVQTIAHPGTAHQYKVTDITLDATTITYGSKRLVMALTFETASWTIAVPSGWAAELVWV